MPNGDSSLQATGIERWYDSGSEVGIWKPGNVGKCEYSPRLFHLSQLAQAGSLFTTLGCSFPNLGYYLIINPQWKNFSQHKKKNHTCAQKNTNKKPAHHCQLFNLNLMQKINFLLSLYWVWWILTIWYIMKTS